jgi:hypothetical protein
MLEMLMNLKQAPLWEEELAADRVDVRRVFEGYRATVDWPGCFFWRELVEAWPEAKVILSTRDPHRWYASARDTIFKLQHQPLPPEVTDPDAIEFHDFMFKGLIPRVMDIGGGRRLDEVGEEEAVAAFNRHIEEVREEVPADRLLVFQVSEGWGPLCDFLGVPVPEEEFPHVNESENFEEFSMQMLAERERKLAALRATD